VTPILIKVKTAASYAGCTPFLIFLCTLNRNELHCYRDASERRPLCK